jgi:hypothetical protein
VCGFDDRAMLVCRGEAVADGAPVSHPGTEKCAGQIQSNRLDEWHQQ